MNKSRSHFMRNALLAGGIALGGAALFWGVNGRDGLSAPTVQAPIYPVRTAVTDYEGADDPAVLQARIAQESQGQLTLVMYYATWCPYCTRLTAQMNEATAYLDAPYQVIRVDVERFPQMAAAAKQMDGVPETFVFMNGQQVDHFGGAAADTRMVVNYIRGLSERYPPVTVTKPYISPPTPFPKIQ